MYDGRAARGQRGARAGDSTASTRTAHRAAGTPSRSRSGMCLLEGPAPLDAAVAFAVEHLDEARARGLRSLEADMLHVLGIAEGRRARFDNGRAALRAASEISEELGLRYMAQWAQALAGPAGAGRGRSRGRRGRAAHQLRRARGDGAEGLAVGEMRLLADALLRQGRLSRGRGDAGRGAGRNGSAGTRAWTRRSRRPRQRCWRPGLGRRRRRPRPLSAPAPRAQDRLGVPAGRHVHGPVEVLQIGRPGRRGGGGPAGGGADRGGQGLRGRRSPRRARSTKRLRARDQRAELGSSHGRAIIHAGAASSTCRWASSWTRSPRRSWCRAPASPPRSRWRWPPGS